MSKVKMFSIATVFILSVAGWAAADDTDLTASLEKTKSLISSINLLNGLHLSGEQLQELLELNREAETLHKQYLQSQSANLREAESFYGILHESYSKDQRPSEEIEKRASDIQHQLNKAREDYRDNLADLGERLDAILTDGQRKTVEEFKPCLIPPRSLREPSRAGQARSADMGVQVLTRYRHTMQRAKEIEKRSRAAETARYHRPGRRYYRARYYGPRKSAFASNRVKDAFSNRFFPRFFERIEHMRGEMSEAEKAQEKQRILDILDRGAAMSDQEFSLNSEQLAEEIFAPYEEIEKEMRTAMSVIAKYRGQPGRAATFLIRADLIPVLEERTAQFAAHN